MASHRERFFEHQTYAIVGNTDLKPFPQLTFKGLRRMGKTVHAVDLSGRPVPGADKTLASISELPDGIDGAVVEVPKSATLGVVEQIAKRGIKNVWLHQNSHTEEVLAFCRREGLDVRWGTCAVMYTGAGSYHRVHRGIAKLLRQY